MTDFALRQMVENRAAQSQGFVTTVGVKAMANDSDYRLIPLLVRCGGCRFTAPAQNIAHLTEAIESIGDYVREISFPATEGSHKRYQTA